MTKESKSGRLTKDETWSGEIYVTDDLVVPRGVTLTIEPGTVVKVKHNRNYREQKKTRIDTEGGTIKAIGTPEERIWFTSDAKDPIDYDWRGIHLRNSDDSRFDYVIVEFAEVGIIAFNSDVVVTNSIIRWNNAEGLYAERSKPIFKYNRIYENANHEIALEQYNENVQIRNNIFGPGNCSTRGYIW